MMRRLRPSHSAAHVAKAHLCALVAAGAIALGSPTASAMPKASGSNCGSDWVNNGGALDCFIHGENETNQGNSNPHYVACTQDSEVFCCVNTKEGQVCESQAGAARADLAQQVRYS